MINIPGLLGNVFSTYGCCRYYSVFLKYLLRFIQKIGHLWTLHFKLNFLSFPQLLWNNSCLFNRSVHIKSRFTLSKQDVSVWDRQRFPLHFRRRGGFFRRKPERTKFWRSNTYFRRKMFPQRYRILKREIILGPPLVLLMVSKQLSVNVLTVTLKLNIASELIYVSYCVTVYTDELDIALVLLGDAL